MITAWLLPTDVNNDYSLVAALATIQLLLP